MTAYYNEIDPFAAAWLRELIRAGHIAPGDVDERSIEDVRPTELAGYTQCHFFAGIGVWSYALRQAGVPDDYPVWTGSCPCQPFSGAGKGAGFADERHLWPAWFHLIQQCRPTAIFGEQVAGKTADPWIDLVQADLEAMGYAFGCVPFPSAGLGAPHIRDRNFWAAHSNALRQPRVGRSGENRAAKHCETGRLADADAHRLQARREGPETLGHRRAADADGSAGGLDNSASARHVRAFEKAEREARDETRLRLPGARCAERGHGSAGPLNGFWADADWLLCRDGKWRPVEPGTFPLVDGAPARVGSGGDISFPTAEARTMRLRGYGNAINAEVAETFIRAVMEAA